MGYKKYLFGSPSTLALWATSIDPSTGEITVNGADSKQPTTPFTFDWGDGTNINGWFPQSHTYQDITKNYVISELYQRVPSTVAVNCSGDSLQAAVEAGQPGDILLVTGTCSENVLIRNEKQRLTLDGQSLATLNGPNTGSPTLNVRGKGILIQNFTITGGNSGIQVNRGSNAVINHNNIHNTGGYGVVIDQLAFSVIKNNSIHDNPWDGILVAENSIARIGFDSTEDSTPSSNIIQNNGGNGITVQQTSNARIVGNTIADNTGDGIGVFAGSQADIANNAVNNNGGNGISVSENSGIQLGEDNPVDFFGQPNITTLNNMGYGIACWDGSYVAGHLGSSHQINGTAGQIIQSDSCVNGLVTPPVMVTVPNVVGMTQGAAASTITSAKLTVGTISQTNSPTVPAGNVISQNPAAGTSVSEGSPVNLAISLGPGMVIVPNVVGMAQAVAQSAITAAGLTVGTITQENSDTIPAGNVISQSPAAGTSVAQGSPVDLVISLGPSLLPAPTITGFSPPAGAVGTSVTVNGNNFDVGGIRVTFNGVPAVISKFTSSSITTAVPLGANTGPIKATTSGGTASSASDFAVPSLYDFSLSVNPQQATAAAGSQVTYTVSVSGSEGFTGLVTLSIQGLPDGFSGFFSPRTITSGQSSTLSVTACDCTLSSPATLTINGSATIEGKTVTRSAQVSLDLLSPGITTLVGRVLDTDGIPIKNVTIKVEDSSTTTDDSGNFTLENPPTADHVVLIDGSTASTVMAHYPTIPITMNIIAGQTNALPYVPHLHAQKNSNFTPISPTKETKAEDPEVPGLQLRIPPGVDIIGWDGEANTKVSMRKVPMDALPVPPPPPEVQGNTVYMFYFGKQGGGAPTTPIPVTVPNDLGLKPGEKAELWYFNESPNINEAPNQWDLAGTGTVSADGKTITADPGVGIPRFCCGAIIWAPTSSTGKNYNPDSSCPTGDPVDPSTGIFFLQSTDLTIPGRIPINITRTYRTQDTFRGGFGIGTYFSYDWYLIPSGNTAALVIPPGSRILFSRQPDGTYINTSQPSYLGARVILNSDGTSLLRLKDGTTLKFNSALGGLLVEQADRNGNKLTFLREVEGNVTKIIGTDGRTMVNIGVVILGRDVITSLTDIVGRKVIYTYNYSADPGTGRLMSVTDPAGGVTRYEYDSQGRMNAVFDPRGNLVVKNSYDTNSRVCQQEHGDGGVFRYFYVTADQASTLASQQLLAEASSGIAITQDPCSSPASSSTVVNTVIVDPKGNATTYRFDGSAFLLSTTNALGQTTRHERTQGSNLLASIADPLGRMSRYAYDNNGNMTSVTDPLGNVTEYTYEPNFSKISNVTDALGQVTQFGYDGRGNLTSITDPLGNTTTIAYDQFGQPISITDPLGNTTTFQYDESGNLIGTTDPLGNRALRTYDQISRIVGVVDPNGRSTAVTYDVLSNITRLQDGLGKETTFNYDLNGNLLSVTDANKNKRSYTYDVRNRLAAMTDPLGNTEAYQYDANDNLTGFTDRKGQTTTYSWDALNRRTKTSYADGSTTNYTFDTLGRLSRIDDSISGNIEYDYATFGCSTCAHTNPDKIIRESTSQGTVNYTYDEIGRRKTMSTTGGLAVNYNYDSASRLIEVNRADLGSVIIDYDKSGRRTSLTLPNGIKTTYGYDPTSRLLNMKHSIGNNTIEDLAYTYDAAGNRISFGRINTQAELAKPVVAAYNVANQMLTFNDSNVTYDANGNLIEKRNGIETTHYSWNARNQLVEMNGPGLNASFKYDALGRRNEKTINGRTIQYLYDRLDIVAEIEDGVITASYLRNLRIDEILARIYRNGVRYYVPDALGSTIALTDQFGTIKTLYEYDSYGKTFVSGEANDNPFEYTGRENDGTGLFYYRARYYTPELQRFISEDPKGFNRGNLNLYAYVQNNPVNFVDVLGLQPSFPDPTNPPSDWKPDPRGGWWDPDGNHWNWHPDPSGEHGGDHWDVGGPKGPGGEPGKQEWWPKGGKREPKPPGKERPKPPTTQRFCPEIQPIPWWVLPAVVGGGVALTCIFCPACCGFVIPALAF